jgi:hypothetical protein
MIRDSTTKPKISSFAAPTEEEIAAFEALPEDERRRLIETEIEKGLAGEARKVTPEEIIAAVTARRRDG